MDFDKLTEYLDSFSRDLVPGIDLIVYKDHNEVYRHFSGFRDRENNVPLDGNELYWIFSCTKVFTVTAAMQLIQQGRIKLDDPVSKYLPAYETLCVNEGGRIKAVNTPMKIRHLFTMTGGLSYDLNTPSIQKALLYTGGKADTLTLVNAFAEEPLLFEPGTHYRYSLCHDVLAAVVEVVSGLRYRDYLKRYIFEPLGITRTGFHGENMAEFAQQYLYDTNTHQSIIHPEGNVNVYRLSPDYDSGGAGLFSCVNDYILLSDALACGGVGKTGKRILESATIDLMRLPQMRTETLRKDALNHTGPCYTYAFGVRTVIDTSGVRSPMGEFGWDGAANAYTLIDPKHKLSLYLAMHIRSFGYGYEHIHPTVRDMVYDALEL